jgi:hypothetical protein
MRGRKGKERTARTTGAVSEHKNNKAKTGLAIISEAFTVKQSS